MYIQLQINFDKMLIFNISILKQAAILKQATTFTIVYICFLVTAFCYLIITK